MKIRIDDAGIGGKLQEIRKRVGGEYKTFIPRPFYERVEVELEEKDIQSLFHPSGLLVKDNQPVFAYIRDHTVGVFSDDPHERRKVHFFSCSTLTQMKRSGRYESRYRVTNRDDNKYLVDIPRWGRGSKEILADLYPCQNCLNGVRYRGFSFSASGEKKRRIIESFDAKEAMPVLRQRLDSFRRQTRSLRSAAGRTDYPSNWRDISYRYRASKKFICGKCGVDLSRRNLQGLTDTDHIDGDKRNNKYENLQCLCKICHAEKHPHYKVPSAARKTIEQARESQGLTTANNALQGETTQLTRRYYG